MLFSEGRCIDVEIYRPRAVKRKVARYYVYGRLGGFYGLRLWVEGWNFELQLYSSKRDALRGARRFCKKIGYECEIVDGVNN